MNDISFNLVGFFRLLVYVRILNPASKIQTIRNNSEYYDEILSYSYVFNIYDTLDFMYKYKNNIINRMHKSLVSSFNRTTSCIYYDCTNFFFETERPDDDGCDEEGNIIKKGIRKFPISRANTLHFDTLKLYQNVIYKMAGEERIELSRTVLETIILPLNYSPKP